jgi:hypothetical protein
MPYRDKVSYTHFNFVPVLILQSTLARRAWGDAFLGKSISTVVIFYITIENSATKIFF